MLQIDTSNSILIDGRGTGLKLTQRREGTVIYSTSHSGADYKEHKMPRMRYSTAHDAPRKPGEAYDPEKCAGLSELEADVRALLAAL